MLNWYVYGEHARFTTARPRASMPPPAIDLEIQEGRGSAATTQAVAAKTADFGYVDVPTMICARQSRARRSRPRRAAANQSDVGDGLCRKEHQEAEDIKGKTVAITPAIP